MLQVLQALLVSNILIIVIICKVATCTVVDTSTTMKQDDDDNHKDEGQPQPQPPPQQQHNINDSEYYEFFDQVTNNGKVFDEDMSAQVVNQKTLTDVETKARTAYQKKIKSLNQCYDDMDHPVATTKEEVLQQRIFAKNIPY